MTNRSLVTGLLGVGSCITCAAPLLAKAPAKADAKPNILIIYTDDMGIGDVSFMNDGWVRTPNLDKLASQGLTVNNYYSAAPVSSPSRVGLTTGMTPLQWGINTYLSDRRHNSNCEQFDYLDSNAPTMARTLKSAGYATGHFGKWHMGGGRDVHNAPSITSYGFDEYVSTWESPDPDPAITGDSTWIWSNKDDIKRWNRTAYFVDKTLDFMSRHKSQPCFVNLWADDVHTPWVQDEATAQSKKGWNSQINFREVLIEYDKQIGRLMQGLEELGLAENTIIIFTSDNGPSPSFSQQRTNGLRGTKNSLYEGGIRMPFVIRWSTKIAPGVVDKTSVICATDLLPSLCAITGAALPKGFAMSGENMSRALTGSPQKRTKDLMWDFGRNKHYANPAEPNHSPHIAIRVAQWKLLMNSDGTQVELYNIAEDQNETKNVAQSNQKIVDNLKIKLLSWWDTRKIPTK